MSRMSAHRLNELQGYMELGMERESLSAARQVLRSTQISAGEFWHATDAVLVQANRLKPWRRVIETAFGRLNAAGQEKCSRKLFQFFVALSDWKAARPIIPKSSNDPSDLLFSMWTLLELREMEQAQRVYNRCQRIWRNHVPSEASDEDSEFVVSILTEAMAAYLAQRRKWQQAEELWSIGQDLWPFAPNAWEGLTKLHALRGLLKANDVFDYVRDDEFWSNSCVLNTQQNALAMRRAADIEFHRYAKHFAKIVPARERWRFGL